MRTQLPDLIGAPIRRVHFDGVPNGRTGGLEGEFVLELDDTVLRVQWARGCVLDAGFEHKPVKRREVEP
jgi:hypothetical protein